MWTTASTEVKGKCNELTKAVDGSAETAKEPCVTGVGEKGTARPDSVHKRKVKAKEVWRKRVNETRTVLDRLMTSRAQLPSGGDHCRECRQLS